MTARTTTAAAGRAAGAGAEGRLLSIGAVLNTLRDDFPEVTISKIRFLESEGLVEPRRTPSGYRKFSPEDVERLVYVLRMQRDHYLPLKVIREHLDAMDRGEEPPALPAPQRGRGDLGAVLAGPDGMGAPGGDGSDPQGAGSTLRLGRAELLAAAGVEEEDLVQWESYGLVWADRDGSYDGDVLAVAKLVADLGRYGLEPRHLRAVKAAADREVGLVEQVVAPLRRHRNPQTRTAAEATARELATLSVRLHAALVQALLRTRLAG
ncbi:transcriptional regulator FtsR [Allostreptomyces psammosilenae]|uniref:DNA-binding transcriptional MerR regulator n=1 Tax=Allostreptomyces psammosilenae TaxID=1892865 RepID=A0A853A317_9ACTN|nr:MerR family transcriptional regulator [Allostreptomyces psammosilenae]NYI05121.1 DNA-binding transcriptional MerR regulator [Allostreptomyces psammosilenae]